MREGRCAFEVCGEGKCCEGGEDSLDILLVLCAPHGDKDPGRWRDRYHRNPNMNPPTRQKPMHNRPLRREHIRILFRFFLLLLLLRESRARIVHRVIATDDSAIAGLHYPARGMRRRAKLVGLAQDI